MSSDEYFGKALQTKIDLMLQIAGEDAYYDYEPELGESSLDIDSDNEELKVDFLVEEGIYSELLEDEEEDELEDDEEVGEDHDEEDVTDSDAEDGAFSDAYHDDLTKIIDQSVDAGERIVDDGLRTYAMKVGDDGLCMIHFGEIPFDVLAENFDYQCSHDLGEALADKSAPKIMEEDSVLRGVRFIEAYIDTKLWIEKNRGSSKERYQVILAGIGAGVDVAAKIRETVMQESTELYPDFEKRCEITVIENITSLKERIFTTPIEVKDLKKAETLFQKLCSVYALPYPERVPYREYGEDIERFFETNEGIECTIIKNHNRKIFEPFIPDIVRIKSNLFLGAIFDGRACGVLTATIGNAGIQIDYIDVDKDENGKEAGFCMLKMLIQIQEECKLGPMRILLWENMLQDEDGEKQAEKILTDLGFKKSPQENVRYEMSYDDVKTSPLNNREVKSDLEYVALKDIEMSVWEGLEEQLKSSKEQMNPELERLAVRSYNRYCTLIAMKEGQIKGAMLIGGDDDVYWIHRLYTFDMKPADILYMTQLVMKRIGEDATEENPRILFETERKDRGEYFKQYAQGKISTTALSYVKE